MKRIISLVVLICAFASSSLAAAPDTALQLLTLGNQKAQLKQALAGAAATVIVDPALSISPAEVFGLDAAQLTVVKADDPAVAQSLNTPLVVVLGTADDAIWAMYAATLQSSPELIHAVLKGQTAVVGALLDEATGAATILGAHPDLLVMAGQYLLGAPVQAPATDEPVVAETAAPEEAQVEAAPEAQAEEKVTEETAKAPAAEASEAAPAAAAEATAPAENAHAEAQASGGGFGFIGVLLFVAALVGTIIYMDKTVLKS